MRQLGVIGAISLFCWFGVTPATGRQCDHWNHHDETCWDCNQPHRPPPFAGRQSSGWGPSSGTADVRSLEGEVTEIVYLPGSTPKNGMVEIRVQSEGRNRLIRLAPSGFLKQAGLVLREGDSVRVKGYRVDGMDGELIVAVEIHKGDQGVSLRDVLGRPAW